MERFTRREILRILNISSKQLAYWERLRLVEPRTGWGEKFYRFGDLISLRTVKQLVEQRVPARRRRRGGGGRWRRCASRWPESKRRSPSCASSPTGATSPSSSTAACSSPSAGSSCSTSTPASSAKKCGGCPSAR